MATARERKPSSKERLAACLHNPTQLRLLVTCSVLGLGYLAVFSPLSADFDHSARSLNEESKRLETATEIEALRSQYQAFRKRLPEKSDTNEWVQYILSGVRQFPLELLVLDPDLVQDFGPYKAVVLKIDVKGGLPEMNAFLKWLETNERLLRVDMVNIQPDQKRDGSLNMHLVIVGVMS